MLHLVGVLGLVVAADARAEPATACQVHVILFVPKDVRPPTGYQPRIDEIVDYTEAFFRRELKRWGHDEVVMPFRRAPGGRVEVTVVRGKERTVDYKPVAVRVEVMDFLRQRRRLDGSRQLWWILVYPGEPPARFQGFLGGFGPEIGGWAVCNFDTTPGRVDPAAPLGAPFLDKLALKGMIHELGHGFGLPHVGPLDRDGDVNTLMGPTHANFRRVRPRGSPIVRLSEAEAAMFANHPAFKGATDDRRPLPTVEVKNLKYSVRGREKAIVVAGKLQAGRAAAYALVADESDARPGEYWTKTYVGKIAHDGAFEVIVAEPAAAGGTLKTWFAFEDGTQTGDGKRRGRESGIAKAYTYKQSRWTFK
jgi:hypothetical protein